MGRVGSHVGDESDFALAGELDALVELLCGPHGSLGGETKGVAGGSLKRSGDERCA